ncbi:HAD-IIB family hydrolase [Candidatus Saccharibacteria bacterium]|nr:HAD-IIB family hydrolase [Candidatus Saccharibacteria bacterium]
MQETVEVTKRMLAFDIDHTLSLSKEPIPKEVAELLTQILEKFEVCIISGRSFEQFLVQVIGKLPDPKPELLEHLYLFPAQGTQYYKFEDGWEEMYVFEMREEQISKIFATVETAAKELGYWREVNPETNDKVLENRLSQVTFAGVDTGESVEVKKAWDPDCAKRKQLIARCKEIAPEFEYKIGGNTSIDITQPGMDKGFGMKKLMEELDLPKEAILYFGDMTEPGGNDYPVVQLGIDTITVTEYYDTVYALKGILSILS